MRWRAPPSASQDQTGGLLAPMFMSSAALGGAYAMVIDRFFPTAGLAPGAFALVAMGAVFWRCFARGIHLHHLRV